MGQIGMSSRPGGGCAPYRTLSTAAPRRPMMWGDGSSSPYAKIELPALIQRMGSRQQERTQQGLLHLEECRGRTALIHDEAHEILNMRWACMEWTVRDKGPRRASEQPTALRISSKLQQHGHPCDVRRAPGLPHPWQRCYASLPQPSWPPERPWRRRQRVSACARGRVFF